MFQINKEILKASKNNHSSWRATQLIHTQLARIWRRFERVVLFKILCLKWPVKKYCAGKILQGISERFLYENDRDYNSYKFSYKFTFIPFLSIHRNQKQGSNFQQVDDLVTRNTIGFFYSKLHSTSKVCQIQFIIIKIFSHILFLLVL